MARGRGGVEGHRPGLKDSCRNMGVCRLPQSRCQRCMLSGEVVVFTVSRGCQLPLLRAEVMAFCTEALS